MTTIMTPNCILNTSAYVRIRKVTVSPHASSFLLLKIITDLQPAKVKRTDLGVHIFNSYIYDRNPSLS